VSVKRN